MKRFLFILVFLSISLEVKAQYNRISFFYGFTKNNLYRSESLDGGPGYDGKNGDLFGINYQRNLNSFLALETGFSYSTNKIRVIPEYFPDTEPKSYDVNIDMITIPVYARFTFLKFLYISAGALIDLEINRDHYPVTDDQSGIGFGGGIGTEFIFKKMTIFINPVFRYHAVIPFQKESYQQHLTEASLLFGLGYNF